MLDVDRVEVGGRRLDTKHIIHIGRDSDSGIVHHKK